MNFPHPPRLLVSSVSTVLAVFSSFVCPARAQDDAPGPEITESPYFHVLSDIEPGVDALPLKDTHVAVTIAGVIADVTVTQTYANEGAVPLEAKYVFPGSTRAAVHGLTMTIGDREVRAKIQKKDDARRTYEAAKSAGKSAALLEQHRPNVFEMNLANILPGDVIEVVLRYTELLRPEDGVYEFVYPTVVGPRYVGDRRAEPDDSTAPQRPPEAWTATPYLKPGDAPQALFDFHLRLAAGVPVAHVTSPSHPIMIETPRADSIELSLDTSVDPTSHANRDIIIHYQLSGDAVQAGLITSREPGANEGYFLAMIQPPARTEPAAIPPRDYVFIVDVSGSMNGFPLQTTKRLLTDLVAAIRPTDTFNIVLFAGSSSVLSSAPVPATAENLARAIVLLERQQAGGGTNLLPALETGLRLPRPDTPTARTFVVVTDGYVAVEAAAFELVRSHLDQASVFAFGIGTSVNRHLIEGLARAGQGEPFIVTSADEAASAAVRFRNYIESPVLTGVHVAFEGITALDVTPGTLPDLFAQRPVILFGKFSDPAAGTIRLTGNSGLGLFSTELDFAGATRLDGNRAIELLWARAHIAALEDMEQEGRNAERVTAITHLGLTHGLLTKYTSFVAVDEVVRNTNGAPLPVKQPVPLPEGVSTTAVGGQAVATTPEPGGPALLLIAALALAAARRRFRRRREAA